MGFENTCEVSGKWNVSSVFPRLSGWVCKISKLIMATDEDSVVVAVASYQPGVSPLGCRGWSLFGFRSSGGTKFVILDEDSDNGGPSSITLTMEYLFALKFWCCKLSVGNQWGARHEAFY